MKKTQKRVFGLLGLSLVAGMTAVAATIPSPGASATSTSSVTDTLVIRVVGDSPDVNISRTYDGVTYGDVVVDPIYWLVVDYTDINKLELNLAHTDASDAVHNYKLSAPTPDYDPGTLNKQLLLSNYGYGKYVFTASGYGISYDEDSEEPVGFDEDSVSFSYVPVMAVDEDNTGTDYTIVTDQTNADISYVTVTIDGKVVTGVNPDGSASFDGDTPMEFQDGDLIPLEGLVKKDGDGYYQINLTAYDDEGNMIYKPFSYRYVSELIPDTGAPDTGGLFRNLNISSEDYLVTGLIVFFIISIVALGVVARGRKTQKAMKRRR